MGKKRQTILEWYQQKQEFIDAPCGGKGNCGRCKVRFLTDAPIPQEKEKRLLSEDELSEGIRLACVTEMEKGAQFTLAGALFSNKQMVIPVGVPQRRSPSSKETGQIEKNEPVGIALDIGTTTLAMALISLVSGKRIKVLTSVNSQRAFGADVISRIQAANQGKGDDLQKSILQDIWKMLLEMVHTTGIEMAQIKKIAIAGNTTMCHLLLGYSCEGLGRVPFIPENIGLIEVTTDELFAKLHEQIKEDILYKNLRAEVVILPGISAFVGADIVAGMYDCDMDLQEDVQMLLDIGTNGEIVIGNQKGFYVTSTAAGPVFEGGSISCGMPAVKGAASHIKSKTALDENGKKRIAWECEVLGDGERTDDTLKGICGSGLIELGAALWQERLIDENGTLTDEFFDEGIPVRNLRITQSDIRELQMGKAAIRAGIEILLEKKRPEKIYLAGGFGNELNIDAAIAIGLLHSDCKDKTVPVGNAVLSGLWKFLLDEEGKERVMNLVEKSEEVVLSQEANFEEKYILFMQFLL